MKKKNKVYLQCGYEDECKHKDCLKCRRNFRKYILNLSQAEQIAIEDFAMVDIIQLIKEGREEDVELMQDIMRKVFHKMVKQEGK
jgi:hypothetical protein